MKISPKFVIFVCLLLAFVSGNPNEVDERKNIVSTNCLRCICIASTRCNLNAKCDGPVCGPYRISLGYWIDAGRPIKVKDNNNDVEDEDLTSTDSQRDDQDYRACTTDLECASRTVEGYMQRYAADCDGDGKINCDDFARIHRLGPGACSEALDYKFERAYKKCIKNNPDEF